MNSTSVSATGGGWRWNLGSAAKAGASSAKTKMWQQRFRKFDSTINRDVICKYQELAHFRTMDLATNECDRFNPYLFLFVDLLCLVLYSDSEWKAIQKVRTKISH